MRGVMECICKDIGEEGVSAFSRGREGRGGVVFQEFGNPPPTTLRVQNGGGPEVRADGLRMQEDKSKLYIECPGREEQYL